MSQLIEAKEVIKLFSLQDQHDIRIEFEAQNETQPWKRFLNDTHFHALTALTTEFLIEVFCWNKSKRGGEYWSLKAIHYEKRYKQK